MRAIPEVVASLKIVNSVPRIGKTSTRSAELQFGTLRTADGPRPQHVALLKWSEKAQRVWAGDTLRTGTVRGPSKDRRRSPVRSASAGRGGKSAGSWTAPDLWRFGQHARDGQRVSLCPRPLHVQEKSGRGLPQSKTLRDQRSPWPRVASFRSSSRGQGCPRSCRRRIGARKAKSGWRDANHCSPYRASGSVRVEFRSKRKGYTCRGQHCCLRSELRQCGRPRRR